jgi:hypothetical protein
MSCCELDPWPCVSRSNLLQTYSSSSACTPPIALISGNLWLQEIRKASLPLAQPHFLSVCFFLCRDHDLYSLSLLETNSQSVDKAKTSSSLFAATEATTLVRPFYPARSQLVLKTPPKANQHAEVYVRSRTIVCLGDGNPYSASASPPSLLPSRSQSCSDDGPRRLPSFLPGTQLKLRVV